MNKHRTLIVSFAILAAIAVVVIISVSKASSGSVEIPATEAAHTVETTSQTLVAPVQTTVPKITTTTVKKVSQGATTTTSEVPPHLTAEQEQKITEGMNSVAQDYDLPSETTTTIEFLETQP